MSKAHLLLLPFFLLCGCSSETDSSDETAALASLGAPSDDSAEASVRFILKAMKEGQPVVLWNSLPQKQQDDINDIVRTFASTMDQEVWKQGASIIAEIQGTLESKSEFFANYPAIANAQNSAAAKDAIPQLAGLLKTILDGAGNLEALQSFDGQKFTSSTGTKLFSHLEALAQAANQAGGGNSFSINFDAKVETVDATDTSATLKITASNGTEELQNFMKVDGKWVPMNLVQNWDENVKNLRDKMKQMPAAVTQAKPSVSMASGFVTGMLGGLKNASTQEEFNAALENIVGQAAMMIPPMGFGGPPTSAPPTSAPSTPPEQGSLGDAPAAPATPEN